MSWGIIIALFLMGAWPFALAMLLYKLYGPSSKAKNEYQQAPSLSQVEAERQARERKEKLEKQRAAEQARKNFKALFDTPNEDKRTSRLLLTLGGIFSALSLLTLFGLESVPDFGMLMFIISNFIAGGSLLFSGIQMKGAMKRYARYSAIIGSNEAYEVELLASKSGYSRAMVERDLRKMLEKGYFGESAYLNKELGYIFMSSQADKELEKARLAAMEKTKEAAKAEAAKQTASVYDQLLFQIRDVNDRIPSEEMTEKIYQIENITRQIFEIVEKEPKKRSRIDRFMSYYLPTTLKLLEHYAALDKTKVEGENISRSKQSIENAMDSIVDGFRRQLDDLYSTENLDIETDIDVMMQMMDRDKKNSESAFKTPASEASSSSGSTVSFGGSAAQTK